VTGRTPAFVSPSFATPPAITPGFASPSPLFSTSGIRPSRLHFDDAVAATSVAAVGASAVSQIIDATADALTPDTVVEGFRKYTPNGISPRPNAITQKQLISPDLVGLEFTPQSQVPVLSPLRERASREPALDIPTLEEADRLINPPRNTLSPLSPLKGRQLGPEFELEQPAVEETLEQLPNAVSFKGLNLSGRASGFSDTIESGLFEPKPTPLREVLLDDASMQRRIEIEHERNISTAIEAIHRELDSVDSPTSAEKDLIDRELRKRYNEYHKQGVQHISARIIKDLKEFAQRGNAEQARPSQNPPRSVSVSRRESSEGGRSAPEAYPAPRVALPRAPLPRATLRQNEVGKPSVPRAAQAAVSQVAGSLGQGVYSLRQTASNIALGAIDALVGTAQTLIGNESEVRPRLSTFDEEYITASEGED
jgi:hypothetical protein